MLLITFSRNKIEGCERVGTARAAKEGEKVSCQCNHLTDFAILAKGEEYSLFGSSIWLPLTFIYPWLLLVAFVQLGRLLIAGGCQKRLTLWVHVLMVQSFE